MVPSKNTSSENSQGLAHYDVEAAHFRLPIGDVCLYKLNLRVALRFWFNAYYLAKLTENGCQPARPTAQVENPWFVKLESGEGAMMLAQRAVCIEFAKDVRPHQSE
jgi:hypothetical protein